MHLAYAILQKGPKLKYTYIIRDDYTSSTISRRMNEFDDRILIHEPTPTPEPRSHARVYNDAYYILKTNTPTPMSSYASSTMSYADPSTTYTTARTNHRILEKRHKRNLDPLRYKVGEIPLYVFRSNLN